jgi:hypothetical protein
VDAQAFQVETDGKSPEKEITPPYAGLRCAHRLAVQRLGRKPEDLVRLLSRPAGYGPGAR